MDDAGKTALQEEYLAAKASVVEAKMQVQSAEFKVPSESANNGHIPALQAMFGKNETFLREAIAKGWNPLRANRIYNAREISKKQQSALTAQVKTGKNMTSDNKGDVFLAGFGGVKTRLVDDTPDKRPIQQPKALKIATGEVLADNVPGEFLFWEKAIPMNFSVLNLPNITTVW